MATACNQHFLESQQLWGAGDRHVHRRNRHLSFLAGIDGGIPAALLVCVPSFQAATFLNFLYLFLAVLGIYYCARAFCSCGERELLQLLCWDSSLWWLLLSWSMGFAAPRNLGSSWTKDRTCVPTLAGGFLSTGSPGPH